MRPAIWRRQDSPRRRAWPERQNAYGADKTTLVRMLAALLPPDSGTVQIAGFDVVRQADEARRRIGLTGQFAAVDDLRSSPGHPR